MIKNCNSEPVSSSWPMICTQDVHLVGRNMHMFKINVLQQLLLNIYSKLGLSITLKGCYYEVTNMDGYNNCTTS